MANEEQISQFVAVTGSSTEQARFYLESANGDVDAAVSSFLDSGGADGGLEEGAMGEDDPADPDEPYEPQPEAPAASLGAASGSGGGAAGASGRPVRSTRAKAQAGVRGLGDLDASTDDDSEDGERGNELYTGGAKSGQVVRAPKKDKDKDKADVDSVFDKAREAGAESGTYEDLHGGGAPAGPSSGGVFQGQARRLAGEPAGGGLPSPQAPPRPPKPEDLPPISHTIRFYQDGMFTVNGGPPRDMRAPENDAFMKSVGAGECPRELEPPVQGQRVNVNLVRGQGPYVAPPTPAYTAFGGTAHSLTGPSTSAAAVTEGGQPSSSAAAGTGAAAAAAAPPAGGFAASDVTVSPSWRGPDESQPCTSVQLRLMDGSRLVARFNLTQTVGDLRAFIAASRPDLGSAYRLATAFPPTELADDTKTLRDAGLANAVVVQKKG